MNRLSDRKSGGGGARPSATGSRATHRANSSVVSTEGFDPARIFTQRQRYQIGAMLMARDNATGPLCAPLGNWLVGVAQRAWPRLSGLRWFHKTNCARQWVIVSYHHPARLCWSWALHITLFRKGYGRLWKGFRYGQCHARIPYLIELSWHRQTYDWMLSDAARRRLECAALYQPRREPEVSQKEAAL